jgi:hypothetical protein
MANCIEGPPTKRHRQNLLAVLFLLMRLFGKDKGIKVDLNHLAVDGVELRLSELVDSHFNIAATLIAELNFVALIADENAPCLPEKTGNSRFGNVDEIHRSDAWHVNIRATESLRIGKSLARLDVLSLETNGIDEIVYNRDIPHGWLLESLLIVSE